MDDGLSANVESRKSLDDGLKTFAESRKSLDDGVSTNAESAKTLGDGLSTNVESRKSLDDGHKTFAESAKTFVERVSGFTKVGLQRIKCHYQFPKASIPSIQFCCKLLLVSLLLNDEHPATIIHQKT